MSDVLEKLRGLDAAFSSYNLAREQEALQVIDTLGQHVDSTFSAINAGVNHAVNSCLPYPDFAGANADFNNGASEIFNGALPYFDFAGTNADINADAARVLNCVLPEMPANPLATLLNFLDDTIRNGVRSRQSR